MALNDDISETALNDDISETALNVMVNNSETTLSAQTEKLNDLGYLGSRSKILCKNIQNPGSQSLNMPKTDIQNDDSEMYPKNALNDGNFDIFNLTQDLLSNIQLAESA